MLVRLGFGVDAGSFQKEPLSRRSLLQTIRGLGEEQPELWRVVVSMVFPRQDFGGMVVVDKVLHRQNFGAWAAECFQQEAFEQGPRRECKKAYTPWGPQCFQ